MRYIIDFLRQTTPRSGKDMPAYYQKALVVTDQLIAVYMLLYYFLTVWATSQWMYVPAFLFSGAILLYLCIGRLNVRAILLIQTLTVMCWSGWYIHHFGWQVGGQHFLIPLLALCFFNIYELPGIKVFYFVALLLYRMLLFAYAGSHPPVYALSHTASVIFQSVNSVILFINLGVLYILFSSSIQDAERKLLIDNQELHKEAGTDPLTRLPNRRAMLDEIELFQKTHLEDTFCIAIADIDFFKKVNDTYGHNCGDYTLRQLSDKFLESCNENCHVCRWGGEEFCFFLPEQNLDIAAQVMHDIHVSVGRMPLSFEGNDFSITITIGIEEYDFVSPLEVVLDRADRKLYMGKVSGRNQVVV